MTNAVATYLKYANLQMAAESTRLDQFLAGTVDLRTALTDGNNRSSKFANVLADQFIADKWVVVAHQADTTTGFSGTLFKYTGESDPLRGLVNGELVMSFRSTEFIDDAVRDNQATNSMEISEYGWAFGQIADMKSWVDGLYASGKITADKQLTVTGYSLGGHLATAFNMLFPGDANATYTFNGAGVGKTTNGVSLATTISQFDQMRNANGDLGYLFTDPEVRSLYESLSTVLRGGTSTALVTSSQLQAARSLTRPDRPQGSVAQAQLLLDALTRIQTIQAEAARIGNPPLSSGGVQPNPLVPVNATQVEATDLNYQLAVLVAARNTAAVGAIDNGAQAFLGRRQGPYTFANFYDVYGDTSPSAVSNSQLHYGLATPVFIEDQPLWRGSVISDSVANSLAYWDVKLLDNNFTQNDFGDTHSLVLLVDSLSVQNTLATLDPLVLQSSLNTILRAASNAKKDESSGTQGHAEGNVLENVLNALSKMLQGSAGTTTPASMIGGTWARIEDRNTFYANLKSLTDSDAFKAMKGNVAITPAAGDGTLPDRAKTDFTALLSLMALLPLQITVFSNAPAIDAALQTAWTTEYARWSADKSLNAAQRGAGQANYSDAWLYDRQALLQTLATRNVTNIASDATMYVRSAPENTVYTDATAGVRIKVVNAQMPIADSDCVSVAFAAGSDDVLNGGSKGDRLYGGGGADTIIGLAGNDYLEGNADNDQLNGGEGADTLLGGSGTDTLDGGVGNDSLLGGAGTDTYIFTGAYGRDSVLDSDGQGSIQIDGVTLSGTAKGSGKTGQAEWALKQGDQVYHFQVLDSAASTTGKCLVVSKNDDKSNTITIGNFDLNAALSGGYLGIKLDPQRRVLLQQELSSNPFTDVGFDPASISGTADIEEGNAKTFAIYLDRPAQAGDTLTLAFTALGNQFQLILDGGSVAADGAVISLAEGQSDVHFSLLQTGEVDSDETAQLSATYQSRGETTSSSNGWGIALHDAGEAAHIFNGDQRALLRGIETEQGVILPGDARYNTYKWSATSWAGDGTLNGGKPEADFNDVIKGSAQADEINGYGGNDALDGADGEDEIDGGAGDDLIGGGAGSDVIHGGAGNDHILSATGLAAPQRVSPDDQWNPPPGKTLLTRGSTWGVYANADATYVVVGGGSLTMDTADDVVYAEAGDDKVVGGSGADYIDGGDGDDGLWGLGGGDVLVGGAGTDYLHGDGLRDTGYYETLDGSLHGDDFLDGGEGDDTLVAGGADDALYGGLGNDLLWGDDIDQDELIGTFHGNDYLDGGDGLDQLVGGGRDDTLYGGTGNDILYGDAEAEAVLAGSSHGNDYLDGEDGDDELTGGGADDVLYGGQGNDLLWGDGFDETELSGNFHGADYLDGEDGNDQLVGGGRADTLFGGAGNDNLWGDASVSKLAGSAHGADYLDGEDGDDRLIGGGGDDTLLGGSGDDLLIGDVSSTDEAEQLAAVYHGRDELDGGDGNDVLTGAGGSDVLLGGSGADTVFGDDALARLAGSAHGDDWLDGGDGDDLVQGDGGNDSLYGGGGNDWLLGDFDLTEGLGAVAGNDYLDGEDGDDVLKGGGGDDTLVGSVGNDWLSGEDETYTTDVSTLTGNDLLSGGAGLDTLVGGNGNDMLLGGDGADLLVGGAGNDLLSGGLGVDILQGGKGDDVYEIALEDMCISPDGFVDVIDDTEGTNTLRLAGSLDSVAIAKADSVDNLSIVLDAQHAVIVQGAAGSAMSIEFSDGGNSITMDRLMGERFQARVTRVANTAGAAAYGGVLDDVLSVGPTATQATLSGGRGDDQLTLGSAHGGTVLFSAGDGSDVLRTNFDLGTTRDAENVLTLGAGLHLGDLHAVNMGNGQFRLQVGSNGTDGIAFASDPLQLSGPSRPFDRIVFADGSTASWADVVGTGVRDLSIGVDVHGTDTNDTLVGGNHEDRLYGLGGDDVLYGGDAHDVLDGGVGNDLLMGGDGDDSLVGGDNGNDTLAGGRGDDEIIFGTTGAAGVAEGGTGDDRIYAFGSDKTVKFALGDGKDKIFGWSRYGAGGTLLFGNGISSVHFRLSPGLLIGSGGDMLNIDIDGTPDSVGIDGFFAVDGLLDEYNPLQWVTFANGTSIDEHDILRLCYGTTSGLFDGSANGEARVGGWGNDTLRGNAGDDLLWGAEGNDQIEGGLGNDDLRGGFGADVLDGGDGHDAIAGGDGNDFLIGGNGRDTLSGGRGDDTLDGGAGGGELSGGEGNDIFRWGRGSGAQRLSNSDTAWEGSTDVVDVQADILPADVSIGRSTTGGNDLVLELTGTGDSLLIWNYFTLGGRSADAIDKIRFSDGTIWQYADIKALLPGPTAGDDLIWGFEDSEAISGGAGNDTIFGVNGNDVLSGDDGNDQLNGGVSASLLVGGAGDDWLMASANSTMVGGQGADAYGAYWSPVKNSTIRFARGDGHDFIGGIDGVTIELAPGILPGDLRLTSYQNYDQYNPYRALRVSIAGTSDWIDINDFFTSVLRSPNSNLVRVVFADGTVWNQSFMLARAYEGTPGDDYINGTFYGEAIGGGDGNDVIYGNDGDDTLQGGAGNDNLTGGIGNDVLDGGTGNDYLVGNDGDDIFLWGPGAGSDWIPAQNTSQEGLTQGYDQLLVSSPSTSVWVARSGGNGLTIGMKTTEDRIGLDDELFPAGEPGRTGPAVESVLFSDGVRWDFDDLVRQSYLGSPANDMIFGAGTDDLLRGQAGNDFLFGDSGSDTLQGDAGQDTLIGGLGNDTYIIARGDGLDTIDAAAGDGEDTIQFASGIAPTDVAVVRSSDSAFITVAGGAGATYQIEGYYAVAAEPNPPSYRFQFADGSRVDTATVRQMLNSARVNSVPVAAAAVLPAVKAKQGSEFRYVIPQGAITDPDANDALTYEAWGSSGSLPAWLSFDAATRTLMGTPTLADRGSVTLSLYGTDPYLEWAETSLTINVGAPNRVPVVAHAIADATATVGSAFTNTVSATAFSDPDTGDVLTLAASLSDGTALPSWLVFNTLTRTFSGTPTAVGPITVRVTASDGWGGSAFDDFVVVSSLVQNLTVTGTTGADTLTGGAGNDTLSGLAGNDKLTGSGGNDLLDGGAGIDTMLGGTGDDAYIVDTAGDTITENANEGIDSVQSTITWTLGSNLENLTLTGSSAINGTGNTLANLIVGNSAANVLDGSAGADTLTGGAGNDTYVVDNIADVVNENANEGTDLVNAGVSYTLGANLENLTLTGSSAINGTGNALDNVLTGNSAANVLSGGTGNDTYVIGTGDAVNESANEGIDTVQSSITWSLSANVENLTLTGTSAVSGTGNALDNLLTGNSAANVLSGGAGNDTYVVGTSDTVMENVNEGIDTVQSSITWTLGSNVENLTLTGTSTINGTGNALDNVLAGNSAANILTGGAGNDTYYVGTGDTVAEGASAGTDTVISSITWTLGSNLENLTLTGTGAINGTGNTQNNLLTGNSAANALDGGTGADTLIGGAGDDSYLVDNVSDLVTENANEGTDLVTASVTYALGANLENLALGGTSAINGTGNVLNNVLTGNSAANVLSGGAGNDTYVVGTGDTVTENANEGIDSVQSAVTWTLGNNVENLTLTGSNAINGTGNALDNWLIGNSANNSLTGAAGNDTLEGGLGSDTMLGGLGNDTYVVNVSTDVVTENAGEGTDTIQSAVTLTLGNNVENLTLTGTSAINATGNTLANTLLGNSGANVLTGAAGDDIYDGGAGNDTFTDSVTSSNDTYRWGIGSGLDTLTDAGGSLDHIDLYAGIAKSQLKFVKNANDLELSVLGQADKLTIKNWYVGTANQIEEFRLSDGSKVLASEVNGLLSAMAAFVPMDSSTGSQAKTRFIDMPISNPQVPQQAWM